MNPFTTSPQRWTQKESPHKIPHAQGLQATIQREKERAVRDRQKLSLVVFHIEYKNRKDKAIQNLLNTIQKRVRLTDEWGWLDKSRLSVMLPNTDAEGARRLAEDISQSISSDLLREPCTLYTYPPESLIELNAHDPINSVHLEVVTSSSQRKHQRANSSSLGLSRTFFWKQSPAHHIVPRQALTIKPFEQLLKLTVHALPWWKRWMDGACSVLGLVLLFPFILLAALSIKCISPGPVFIKQVRVGYKKKAF